MASQQPESSVLSLGLSPWMRRQTGATRPSGSGAAGAGGASGAAGGAGARVAPQEAVRGLRPVRPGDIEMENLPGQVAYVEGGGVEKDSKERKLHALEKIRDDEEAVRDADLKLQKLSRRMLLLGLFGLPLVHFVQVCYFWDELRDKNSNWYVRRNTFLALAFAIFETCCLVAWIVTFQVMSERFQVLSIHNSGLSFAKLV